MRLVTKGVAALAVTALSVGSATAVADPDDSDRRSLNTKADYTPFKQFEPLPASAPCTGAPSGRESDPLLLPEGYDQAIIAEESDTLVGSPTPGSEDLWDMNTQNEFGKDAGRYVYRTHEVGPAPNSGDPPRAAGGSQVTVTDLKTGLTHNLAERNDWERFDGIAWTPWGTILAAEETIVAGRRDPQVPQASGGLVYELFIDEDQPWKLDPSRERITAPEDGTQDNTKDGIRARPMIGARSHEGLRFDRRGALYGIAETRGQTTANQTGGIFRFVPDGHDGDDDDDDRSGGGDNRLAFGDLYVFRADSGGSYGPGRWILLENKTLVQTDSDAYAESKDPSEYQRPEDVETGESTGVDRLNDGNTLYVGITEGAEVGVINIDLSRSSRPFAYQYVGPAAGNAVVPDFNNADNLALDRKGNLAVGEDAGGGSPGGDDVWMAAPPRDDDGHDPARTVQRLASIKDCEAETTGPYFAVEGTERFSRSNPNPEVRGLVNGETLFINRQHSGDGTTVDQGIAVAPVDDDRRDDDD